ncbi:hypothetical protein PIB30_061214 [Stylosanthes scabra]|uniref:Uncharacterized protein n=1 Tax=Stylosanthes scabra TaxID=79078 RepID=A0ABU6QLT0_9FABA|nr:hypothetical protein [Stylosanthes scabra]
MASSHLIPSHTPSLIVLHFVVVPSSPPVSVAVFLPAVNPLRRLIPLHRLSLCCRLRQRRSERALPIVVLCAFKDDDIAACLILAAAAASAIAAAPIPAATSTLVEVKSETNIIEKKL